MSYQNFIKSLELPSGFVAPAAFRYDDIVARALSRADLAAADVLPHRAHH